MSGAFLLRKTKKSVMRRTDRKKMIFVFAVLRGTEESSGWDSTGENNFVLSEQKNEEVSDIVDCPEGNVFCFCGFTRD